MNWARHFGHIYPVRRFPAAPSYRQKMVVEDAYRYVSRNRWWFAGGTIFGLALVTVLVLLLTGQLDGAPQRFRR